MVETRKEKGSCSFCGKIIYTDDVFVYRNGCIFCSILHANLANGDDETEPVNYDEDLNEEY